MELLAIGKRAAALGGGGLAHHACFRPSGHWGGALTSLVLHPPEVGLSSNVRAFDQTLSVDLPWLADLLASMKRTRPGLETLVPQKLGKLNDSLQAAADRLGLQEYVGDMPKKRMQHSGPSAGYAAKRRSIEDIKHRGRWSADASVRRYQKGGRINPNCF